MDTLTPDQFSQILATENRRHEIKELDTAIGNLFRIINSASYELMVMIREFDERSGWLECSFTDAVSWLMWRCDLNLDVARDKLRIAHALKELPLLSKAFSQGNLPYSKVRALTRVATPDNESELLTMARKMSTSHVEHQCQQMKHAEENSVQEAMHAYHTRSLRSTRNEPRGVMTISIEVPIEEGALFEKAVDKVAAGLSGDSALSNARDSHQNSWPALQADAVIAMARDCLLGGFALPDQSSPKVPRSSNADHYQVVVHVDELALKKATDSSDSLKRSSELPIESVRRLCCDGSIVSVFEDTTGSPLSIGRKIRTVKSAIRRELWSRDKGCAFPGCSHTRFVDAHHIEHWANGGETHVENMVLLCSQHHRLVHEGGYSIVKNAASTSGDRFVFKRPDGITLPVT